MTERKGSRILLTQTDRFKRQFISPITERSLLQQTSTYPGSGGEGAARTGNDVSSKASEDPFSLCKPLTSIESKEEIEIKRYPVTILDLNGEIGIKGARYTRNPQTETDILQASTIIDSL